MDKSILHGYIDFLADYDNVVPFPSYKNDIVKWIDETGSYVPDFVDLKVR
jgi:hypothetical protein